MVGRRREWRQWQGERPLRRQYARAAVTTLSYTAAVGIFAALIALAIRMNRVTRMVPLPPNATRASVPTAVPAVPQTTVASSAIPAPDPAADDLWRRSLRAESANGTPIQAHVTVLRWTNGAKSDTQAPSRRSEFDLWEGVGGRYRLAYTAPAEVTGRVVVCDGKTLWQYEARRGVVLRRPLNAATANEDPRPDAPADSSPAVGMTAHLEPGSVTVGGRPTRLVALRDRRSHRLLGRRWIDTETARSLRTETYEARTGGTLHRVELSDFRPASPSDALATAQYFQPDFPATAHVIRAKNENETINPTSPSATLSRLGMPSTAAGYRLRTIVGTKGEDNNGVHLLYSDGAHSLSVFVSETGGGKAVALQPPPGGGKVWQAARVPPQLAVYTHQDGQGRAGVVWVRAGKRYVAASRLPLGELLAFVGAVNRAYSTANPGGGGKTTP